MAAFNNKSACHLQCQHFATSFLHQLLGSFQIQTAIMSRRHSYSLNGGGGGDWHTDRADVPASSSSAERTTSTTRRGGGLVLAESHSPTTDDDVAALTPPLHHISSLDVPNGSHDFSSPHRTSVSKEGGRGGGGPRHPHSSLASTPLPGRILTRRKRGTASHRHRNRRTGFCRRFYVHWLEGTVKYYTTTGGSGSGGPNGSLLVAVGLWYTLGVVSIGTSKVLLSDHALGSSVGSVPPCYLTLQQLLIGSTLLRFLIRHRFLGLTAGLQAWPQKSETEDTSWERRRSTKTDLFSRTPIHPSLVWAAVYFCAGFLATNVAFAKSAASFVETVKASEPLTSAAVAVGWGIEVLSTPEVVALLTIVAGVLLSTLGHSPTPPLGASASSHSTHPLVACAVVMASNLCFSFRGLYQKLFRATPEGSAHVVDDLNLQFRMQQVGAALLILPTAVWDGPTVLTAVWHGLSYTHGGGWGKLVRYATLALLNGCAFAGYNLSSTYLLSRLSVVHHAALNCLRRIFAIVVTSLLFRVPITLLGGTGIAVSVIGFLAFSHYKVRRLREQQQHQQHPSLHDPVSASPLLPTRAKAEKS